MKKKIYKALSILLALMIVFSACVCVLSTASAASDDSDMTYYVNADGKDDGTGEKPREAVKTIKQAIDLANAAGYTTGHTVTIKVKKGDPVSWGAVDAKLPSYKFKLIITSQTAAGGAVVGDGTATVNMGGETHFNNIGVNFGSTDKTLCFNGYSGSFAADVTYEGSPLSSYFALGANKENTVFNNKIDFEINIPIKYVTLSNEFSEPTFNEDVNVTYNASAAPSFWLSSSNGTTTFNKGVNLVIKSASGLDFTRADKTAWGENAYFQVLNNSSHATTGLDAIPANKLWAIDNDLGANDLISLTSTKGVYSVNETVYSNIKATDKSDSTKVYTPVNGTLTLPAGQYTLTAEKTPQIGTYYVKKNATSGDGTEAKPLADVAAAVSKALSDGYIKGDKVTVKIIGEAIDLGTLPAYPFELTIDSNSEAVQPCITADGPIANGGAALTTYKNVEVNNPGSYRVLYLNNSKVRIASTAKVTGSYVSLGMSLSNVGVTVSNDQELIYESATAPAGFYISNWIYAANVYNNPVNFTLDTMGAHSIYFNASYGGSVNGATTYNDVVNVNIKGASSITLGNFGNVTFNKALQVINSATNPIDTTGEVASVDASKKYIINNISGDGNLLEFTDTVGKYKVNLANPEHEVYAKNIATNKEIKYDYSGYLTLPAGVYEVRIERDPIFAEYYVDKDGIEVLPGTRPETAGTKENPVRTFADATRLIAKDGLTEIDVATVYLTSGQEISWKNETSGDATYNVDPSEYVCRVVIDSTMADDKALLLANRSAVLMGPTTFNNVKFEVEYQWGNFIFNHNDVTFEEGSEVTVPYTKLWKTAYGASYDDDVNIIIKGKYDSGPFSFAADYHNHTCNGDINIYVDNPEAKAAFVFGCSTTKTADARGANVYNGNINITVMQAQAMSFSVNPNADFTVENRDGTSTYYDFESAEFNGALQLMVDDSVSFPYSVKTNFNDIEVAGGKWYITNAATDNDFVTFSENKGVLDVKNGAKAYSRQLNAKQVTHTGGTIDLSKAPGAYTVSDKAIAALTDDSHKMLYYRISGGGSHIGTRAFVTPGETYRFEYSIYTSLYEDMRTQIRDDGNRGVTCDVEIISETKMGDYYRIVAEGTIPEDYDQTKAFFVSSFSPYSEGVIFDRTVYNVNDPDKTECLEGNANYHDGLDYVSLNYDFWGAVFSGPKGGKGITSWTDGFLELKVMNFDANFIKELIALQNPNDGEWWNKEDLIEEETFATYGKAKGTFTDQNGDGVKGIKFVLVSDEKTYSDTTDSKGKFDFGTILTGFYDLFIVDGDERIHTGFSSYIAQDDVVEFKVVTDTSGLTIETEGEYQSSDYETTTDTEKVEEIIPSGNLTGTVYTPQLDTVANLKIVLDGVGEVVTAEDGTFGFADIPVGEYTLYAVNSDGSKYEFRTVNIKENVNLSVKLKYDPPIQSDADESDNGWIIWVIVASVVALLVVAALVFFLIFKKKKGEQAQA